MKVCSIMQPTYLPWAGYFNLIAKSNFFVFLDDAQYQKNSWHNRNRLLVNHSPYWITVPVRKKILSQTIKETDINIIKNWRKKHSLLIHNVYCKHPFAKDILGICALIEEDESKDLASLNIKLILWFLEMLDIRTEIFLSSALAVRGKRTIRLIEILKKLKADLYLSPNGAMDYLKEDNFSAQTTINLAYQKFNPKPYEHFKHQYFQSNLSIIDVVANIGWEATRNYIF